MGTFCEKSVKYDVVVQPELLAAEVLPTVQVAYSRAVFLPTPNDHTVIMPTAFTYMPYCHFAYSYTSISLFGFRLLFSRKLGFCLKPYW